MVVRDIEEVPAVKHLALVKRKLKVPEKLTRAELVKIKDEARIRKARGLKAPIFIQYSNDDIVEIPDDIFQHTLIYHQRVLYDNELVVKV